MSSIRPCGTLLIVAAREAYDHVWNPLVWFLVVVAAALAAFATHVGIARVVVIESQYRELLEQREQDRAKNNGRLFGAQTETGLRAIRPPEPLSVLAAGIDGVMPQFWDFSPSGVRTGRVPGEVGNERAGTTGDVDLEFLIRVVLGLLAISLAVQTIAGERESGALLALLGQPVQPRQVLAGKLLGGTTTLAAAVAIVGASALATSALDAPHLVFWDYVASLVMLAVAGVVYAVIFFAAGILISIAFSSYRLALTVTFVTWTVAALIGLRAAGVLVQAMSPVRARPALEADRERLVQTATMEAQNRMGDEFVRALGSPTDWLPRESDPAWQRPAQARIEPMWDEHVKKTRSRLDQMDQVAEGAARRQVFLSRLMAFANPAAEFASAATNLAGTGDHTAIRWEAATAAYQRELDRRLFDDRPRYYAHAPYVDDQQPGAQRRRVVSLDRRPLLAVGEAPAFQPPSRDFMLRLRDASPHLVALALYAAGLLGAAMAAFGRLRFC